MNNRLPITLRLDAFEGPLDLLLFLIQDHQLDISAVSISKITDQYLNMLFFMQELDFDVASEFLVIAATLLVWKSKALLPRTEDAEDKKDEEASLMTQEELAERLRNHKAFLELGRQLSQRCILNVDVFTRKNPVIATQKVLQQMDLTALILCYQDVLIRSEKRFTVLKKETVSIVDKISDFSVFPLGEWIEFDRLLNRGKSVSEKVATFLAMLEMSRMKKSELSQQETYQMIYFKILEYFNATDQFITEFKEASFG
jgi:segregation and condensation protein A